MLGINHVLAITTMFLILAGVVDYVSASAFLAQEQTQGLHGALHHHTPLFD